MVEAYTPNNQSTRWKDTVRWKNTSGETVPAFGCVQVNAYIEDGDYYEIVKPTWHGTTHYLNGPVAVPSDGFGESKTFTRPQPGLCDFLYTDATQIPRNSETVAGGGTQVGPWDNSWRMQTGGVGYRLTSGVSLDSGIAVIERLATDEIFVVLESILHRPSDVLVGEWAMGIVQFLAQDADPTNRNFRDVLDGTGSLVRRPVWNHTQCAMPQGLLGRARMENGRLCFQPEFKSPIVVLTEKLGKAADRFNDLTLPSAVAHHVKPLLDGPRQVGWEPDTNSPVTLFNRAENIEYEVDTLGTYDFFLGKLQFLPLDCPKEESEDNEDFDFEGPPRV